MIALPAKKMKKIIYSILLPMMCFFCFTLTAGAETKTVNLPITVEIDHDMENEFHDLLIKKGYGFTSGPWDNAEDAASLVFSAGEYEPDGSKRYVNSVYAVAANTMEEALEEMLNSDRSSILTRKYKYGAVDCIHYNGKTYWRVTTISTNSPASMSVGKEVKTLQIPVDTSKIKFKLQGWKQASGTASNQVVYGTSSVPEITIPNFYPEKAKGVEYACPAELLTYTSNTPALFTVSANGTVTPVGTGMASMTVALKEDPQVKQDISFEIVSNLSGNWDEELDIKFVNGDSYPYTGSAITPKFYIKDKFGNLLAEGTDYRVEYKDNIDPGTATAYIWPIGNYSSPVYTGSGYTTRVFQITGQKPDITNPDTTETESPDTDAAGSPDANETESPDTDAAGSPDANETESPDTDAAGSPDTNETESPDTGVADSPDTNETESPDTDAVNSPDANVPGSPNVNGTDPTDTNESNSPNVNGTDSTDTNRSNLPEQGSTTQPNTNGASSQKKIKTPNVSLSNATANGKGKIKVKWKKCSKISGYQIQYSTNKNFKKNTKTKKISGKNKTSVTISKLKRKKTYYVRIRTYKKANGKTSYGKWSSIKKVKTK